MRLIVTIAVGDIRFGNMALNLCLSLKAQSPEQKILLIYEPSAVQGIEELVDKYFDYGVSQFRHVESANEFAFYLKTQLYNIVTEAVPEATEIIFLDADTIMLAGKKCDEWFEKHQGRTFTAYCNDIYDYKTKKRKRKDYTFWCDPEGVKEEMGILDDAKIPQINSSFLYFEKSESAKRYFKVVSNVWENDSVKYVKYKGVKPDELCFNLASALTNILPHQSTYRPIFFQFGSEQQNVSYIHHYYKAMGFAGESFPHDYLVKLYNETSDYFRQHFGVIERFIFEADTKTFKDKTPLKILPLKRRTLFREGELPNSNGGIFNPDAIIDNRGKLLTIFRKEVDFDVYKNAYSESNAIPFVYVDESEHYDLEPIGFPDGTRREDFRLFMCGGKIYCNHKIILRVTQNQRDMKTCLSIIEDGKIKCLGIPALPIKLNRTDINWVFFSEGSFMFCIYSLNPYRLFVSAKDSGYQIWDEVEVSKPKLEWFHEQFICNSTNPILIDGYYLVLFHTKFLGIYFHGACLINKETKEIEYYTKHSLQLSSNTEGRQRGLLYVSGAIYLERENVVRVLFGTADSNSEYVEYHKDKLIEEIKTNHV